MKKLLFRDNLVFQLALLWGIMMFSHSTVRSQNENQQIISFELSPIYYFFDGVSPFNTKDGLLSNRSIPFVFKGKFRGSVGVNYGLALSPKHELRIGFTLFQATGYSGSGYQPNEWNLLTRYHRIIKLNLTRNLVINRTFSGFISTGPTIRFTRSLLVFSGGSCTNCTLYPGSSRSTDFGVATGLGLRSKISKSIFAFVALESSAYVYTGKGNIQYLESKGGSKSINHFFPRFNTTLNFGIEFRF